MKRLISAFVFFYLPVTLPAQETYQKETFISSREILGSIAWCRNRRT